MTHRLAQPLKLALLGGVAVLGLARTADAAVIVINADPVYGAQLPGLSWRAVGALYIPDACLAIAQFVNTFPPGWLPALPVNPLTVNFGEIDPVCGTSKIQGVQLQFYESNTNTVVDTLNIADYTADNGDANSNHDLLIGELISFTLQNGQLAGFGTTLSAPVHAPLVGSGDHCFALEFSSATARVESLNYNAASGQCGTSINPRPPADALNPLTRATVSWNPGGFTPGPVTQAPGFSPLPVVVQNVPEPTSLALALLALGAAGAGLRGSRKDA